MYSPRLDTLNVATREPGRTARLLHRLGWIVIVAGLCLFAAIVVRTAWVSDDAYISFRTVDNLLHGYGPRWNIAERVQSYTHPLWMLMLTGTAAVAGNIYLSALGLSFALTACTAVLIVLHLRRHLWLTLLAVATMTLSKAFVDYSTSGLENALSHLLIALLLIVSVDGVRTRAGAFRLGILVALVGTTRLDLLVLAGPIALFALRGAGPDSSRVRGSQFAVRGSRFPVPYVGSGFSRIGPWVRTLLPFALGFWPLAAWEAFSIAYYGVPFPNTAYAKLNTGIPIGASLTQGVSYFLDSLNRDPITLFTVISIPVTAVATRSAGALAPSGAVLLYLLYVLRIGGDFMSGRFFTAPLVVCLCILPRIEWPRSWFVRAVPIGIALALGCGAPDPTFLSGRDFPAGLHANDFPVTGVADERAFYFKRTGLITDTGIRHAPDVDDMMRRLNARQQGDSHVYIYDTIGMPGFYAGPMRHIVDVWALSDPLLARLPAQPKWRIGHYTRTLPDGYIASLIAGRNLIADPDTAALYDHVRLLTRAPIWSRERWKAIAQEIGLERTPVRRH